MGAMKHGQDGYLLRKQADQVVNVEVKSMHGIITLLNQLVHRLDFLPFALALATGRQGYDSRFASSFKPAS